MSKIICNTLFSISTGENNFYSRKLILHMHLQYTVQFDMTNINNILWFITLCCKCCDNGKGTMWVTIITPPTANFAGPTLAQHGSCRLHVGPMWAPRALLSGSRKETSCLTWQANSGASFTITFKKMMMRILHMQTTLHMFPSCLELHLFYTIWFCLMALYLKFHSWHLAIDQSELS